MAKKRIEHDATFGDLVHVAGDLWERPIQLQIFGREWTVSLAVAIDPKDGLEKNQVLAFNSFSQQVSAFTSAAEIAIGEHYQAVCGEYRGRFGITDVNDKRVPVFKSVTDVYKLVEPEGITFPYARRRPTIGILFRCTWETEHGLAVKYEDGKVVEVGIQDIVL